MHTCLPARSQLVLITGGTRGIGAELAKQLDKRKFEVWVAGRRVEKRVQAGVTHFAVDFSDAGAVDEFVGELKRRGQMIDILVNNAATVSERVMAQSGLSENYIVNLESPTKITEALQLNRLLHCVINVISAHAYMSVHGERLVCRTGLKGYFETKFAFFQVQIHLARKYDTRCLFFSPGATATGLQDNLLHSALKCRSPVLFKVLRWLNCLILQSPEKASAGLRRLCEYHSAIETLSIVHGNGKIEEVDVEGTRGSSEAMYRDVMRCALRR